MKIGPQLIIAAWCLAVLVGCKHEEDVTAPHQQGIGEQTDTLALIVGSYEGVLEQHSWSMPNNSSFIIDTVILEVVVDSIQSHSIDLVGVEEDMVVNPDLSLTLLPGNGYGVAHGYVVLGDSIVIVRSQGGLAWSSSHSFKGHKID